MEQRTAQFKHEIKKKEREMGKLKDRLHKTLLDRNKEKKLGNDEQID